MIDEAKKAQAVNWIMALREIMQTPNEGQARAAAVKLVDEVAALEPGESDA